MKSGINSKVMRLKKLLKQLPEIQVMGSREIEITGICSHSKAVRHGNLFVAKRGHVFDGARYIPDAIASGAACVLTETYDPTLRVTQLIHPKISEVEGKIASSIFNEPSKKLFMVGITGTNGKTTTSYIVKQLLEQNRGPCGLIGTIEYLIGDKSFPPSHTTPDVSVCHKLLYEMVQQSCKSSVMEVTSHALDQGRVAAIEYDAAIFTNLSQDHLDYHKTMDGYAAAKAKLFASLSSKACAIVNADDPYSSMMVENCKAKIVTYGVENNADVRAENISLTAEGTSFTIIYQGRSYPLEAPLAGRFNLYNILAAAALALTHKIPIDLLRASKPPPGRMELVFNTKNKRVYIDFAHTPDALEKALVSLKDVTQGRLFAVFGCGGDRDRLKRPSMARAAEKHADFTIVTSDNPRSEDPELIISEIIRGFTNKNSYMIEPDRREAITKAILMADQDDCILVAGRGHEPYQILSHQTVEFDDRNITKEIINAL